MEFIKKTFYRKKMTRKSYIVVRILNSNTQEAESVDSAVGSIKACKNLPTGA